jgi:MFS family permease
MIDNYDNTALAFAIPQLIQEWRIPKMMVGSIFSVGLFGLMLGSIIFGWVGDRFGRKTALLVCLFSFGALTLATTAADSIHGLMILRFLAGLGVGGALPNAIALTNEYSPPRLRVTAVAMIFAGYTLGAAGGGFVAALAIPTYGWQAVFVFGGVVPLILGIVLISALPESVRFLALAPGRFREAAALAARMRPDLAIDCDTLIVVDQESLHRTPIIKDLFRGARSAMTPLLWVIYIANSMVVFALINWLPTLMGSIGIAPGRAAFVAALFAVGGAAGLAPVGESDAARTLRIRQYEDFFNPSGLATSDDNVMYEYCQSGFEARGDEWTQGYSRGLGGAPSMPDGMLAELGLTGASSAYGSLSFGDETCFHTGYREWRRLLSRGRDSMGSVGQAQYGFPATPL